MKRLTRGLTALALLLIAGSSLALDKKEAVGKWTLDEAKSAAAADGNTAGLMKEVEVKADGTFVAMYGTQGTWKIAGGKLLVTYANGFRKDEPASMAEGFLKFPSPAMSGKFCYLRRH
jgi:hypothetical protein